MKRMLAVFLAFLFLLTAGSMTACGDPKKEEKQDTEGTSPAEGQGDSAADPASTTFEALCGAIESVTGAQGEFVPREKEYLENMIGVAPSSVANFQVMVTTEGGRIDEYGVFEVLPGQNVSEIDSALKEYLSFYNDEMWDDRYNPEEYPKLRDAEVKTYGGRFAVYAIMAEADRAAVFGAAENLWK